MAEENKTKSAETPAGPNKDLTPPKVVFVMDSWDGVSSAPSASQGKSDKVKKEKK